MSQQQPNPRGEDTAEAESEQDNMDHLDGLPADAVEALPDHLKGKLESGEARLAGETDVLVDPEDTWWEWEEVTIQGETMLVGFELRAISWQKKNQIFKDNVDTDPSGNTEFDLDIFLREAAELIVVDHTIETQRSLRQLLTGMDNDVGEKLEPYLPEPGAGEIEEAEEKN